MSTFNPSPSKYFNNYDWGRRHAMMEDLVIAALQQKAINGKYMPRQNIVRDNLFGDDTNTIFEKAVTLEFYPKDVDAFQGQGDIFSRFGFQIADTITFTISKKRWRQLQEDHQIEETNDFSDAPSAGDLIWLPILNKVFEITHVVREAVFYQLGKTYTFDLQCELYKYSQDKFDTGFSAVDELQTFFNQDLAQADLTLEDGSLLLDENGQAMTEEDFRLEDRDPLANNEFIETVANNDVIDFDERGPFTLNKDW